MPQLPTIVVRRLPVLALALVVLALVDAAFAHAEDGPELPRRLEQKSVLRVQIPYYTD